MNREYKYVITESIADIKKISILTKVLKKFQNRL